jgi:hypothetical protein
MHGCDVALQRSVTQRRAVSRDWVNATVREQGSDDVRMAAHGSTP